MMNFLRSKQTRRPQSAPLFLCILLLQSLLLQPLAVLGQQPTVAAPAPQAERYADPGIFAERLRGFEEFVKKQMETDKIPGLSIGFIKDGFIWAKGFGYADLENKIPATAQSVYRLASVTKPMTAMAVLRLVEQGKINLDAEIQTYVPEYPKQKWPVTVRQLLAHLGGGQSGSGLGAERKTTKQVVEAISKRAIENEPGKEFLYTTSGYNLLGAAIENVSGQSFNDYLRQHIWAPLDMTETRMDNPRDIISNRVRGYELVEGRVKNAEFVDVSTRFGGGGTHGTILDLLRMARGLDQGKALSKASVDVMYTPVASSGGRFWNYTSGGWDYGLGWFIAPINGRFAVHHDGGQKGTTTALWRMPSEKFAIAFACNLENVDKSIYVQRLYEAVFDEPWYIPVYTKEKTDQTLYKGLADAFNYGLLHLEKTDQPLTREAQTLASAFAYFNRHVSREALQTEFQATESRINDGRHPVANQSFVKVGSFIAARLREKYGRERLNSYHTTGPIAFFGDYVELYRADASYPKELRLTESFERLILRWNEDWKRTWNAEIRALHRNFSGDAAAIEKLKTAFAGAEVYPNFIPQLMSLQRGGMEVVRAAKLAAEIYPRSDRTNGNLAIILLALGDKRAEAKGIIDDTDDARAYLKKAFEINREGIASAKVLNQIANSWANEGPAHRMDKALDVLRLALELYPKEAMLYDTAGNIYLRKGEREQAAEQYRKALEVDPNFERAQKSLKSLANQSQSRGPRDPQELEAFLDGFFATQMAELHVPGAVVTVVKDGKIFFTKGYGYSDLEKRTPVTPEKTLFRAYSVSKSFTATAIMQLVEQGKLKLDEDVNKYLQGFQLRGDFKEPVTLANLLTHTAGFVDTDAPAMFAHGTFKPRSLRDNIAANMPPRSKPLGTFRYSNYGASLGGYIVEAVSGEPFAEYMTKQILNPLGMRNTTFLLPYQLPPQVSANVAVGYRYKDGTYQPMRPDEGDFWTAPAANLLTTGKDIAPFMIAHLQKGRYGKRRILKETTIEEMHRARQIGESPLMAYGFFPHFENNQRGLFHNGGWDGAISQMYLMPEQNIGWFVSYTFGGDRGREMRWRLLSAMLDRYFPE
jgi:CubicO group peptidase (beta-lactamase class C family)